MYSTKNKKKGEGNLLPRMLTLLLWCCCAVLAGAVHAASQPLISAGKDTLFDFGKVARGDLPVHHVIISNRGNSPLHIEHVDSPCGCTTTQLSKEQLAPGDTADLAIRFNSDHFIDDVRKYVIVVSNDLMHRNLFINYHANVVSVLRVTPWFVYFDQAIVGKEESAVLSLENTGKTILHVKNLSSSSGMLQLKIGSLSLVPGSSTKLSVSFTPSQAIIYEDNIFIDTDNPAQPRITIGMRGVVH